MVAPDLKGQVLDPGSIDVSHHLTIFIFQVFDLLYHLYHGIGVEYIGYFQLHDFIRGKIEGHGPGKGSVLKNDLAAEYCGKHDHTEGDEGFGLWVRVAQSHIPESLIEPLFYLHPGLDPDFRIKVVFFSK